MNVIWSQVDLCQRLSTVNPVGWRAALHFSKSERQAKCH